MSLRETIHSRDVIRLPRVRNNLHFSTASGLAIGLKWSRTNENSIGLQGQAKGESGPPIYVRVRVLAGLFQCGRNFCLNVLLMTFIFILRITRITQTGMLFIHRNQHVQVVVHLREVH